LRSQDAEDRPSRSCPARALIGCSRERLAEASNVPAVTIGEFETGKTDPKMSTAQKLRRAMETAGVDFLDASPEAGPGVRRRGERKQ
jgi:transcriptional regulator with XRE-family HTH domain